MEMRSTPVAEGGVSMDIRSKTITMQSPPCRCGGVRPRWRDPSRTSTNRGGGEIREEQERRGKDRGDDVGPNVIFFFTFIRTLTNMWVPQFLRVLSATSTPRRCHNQSKLLSKPP